MIAADYRTSRQHDGFLVVRDLSFSSMTIRAINLLLPKKRCHSSGDTLLRALAREMHRWRSCANLNREWSM
jgi:hypothetical protein